MKNELDKLRQMLKYAQIPFEDVRELWTIEGITNSMIHLHGECGKYRRNQIIYGAYHGKHENIRCNWKFDAICQAGSYGAREGLIETYGDLGCDKKGQPRVMTAKEAFEIIKADWDKTLDKNNKV